jgi:hypothetical protein
LGRNVILISRILWKYINQIVEALADDAPVIVFGKGCWFALGEMGKAVLLH